MSDEINEENTASIQDFAEKYKKLEKENARLREALVKIERDAWETMKEEIENIAREALERGE